MLPATPTKRSENEHEPLVDSSIRPIWVMAASTVNLEWYWVLFTGCSKTDQSMES